MPDSAVDPLNTSLATAHAAGGTAPAKVTPYPASSTASNRLAQDHRHQDLISAGDLAAVSGQIPSTNPRQPMAGFRGAQRNGQQRHVGRLVQVHHLFRPADYAIHPRYRYVPVPQHAASRSRQLTTCKPIRHVPSWTFPLVVRPQSRLALVTSSVVPASWSAGMTDSWMRLVKPWRMLAGAWRMRWLPRWPVRFGGRGGRSPGPPPGRSRRRPRTPTGSRW